jgi:predicted RNase H-like nuclease (RuvC/YqgF family)
MTGTHQRGRAQSTSESNPKILEFVPKVELDRALEEVQRLREKNDRLQREIERLQKELEEAEVAPQTQRPEVRSGTRPAPPSSGSAFRG